MERIESIEKTAGYVDSAYLHATAAHVEGAKHRSYELLRLAPGLRVLELGCGPATDTIALAEIVGPTGRVVGVDHDPEMVRAPPTSRVSLRKPRRPASSALRSTLKPTRARCRSTRVRSIGFTPSACSSTFHGPARLSPSS